MNRIVALLLLVPLPEGATTAPSAPSKSLPTPGPAVITADQAVALGERFVRENGYTEFKPGNANILVPESIEFSGREEWAEERHNTLRPQARGYMKRARNDPEGWTVGFELVEPHDPPGDRPVGRAVTIDKYGGNIRMQHVGFYLDNLRPRPK